MWQVAVLFLINIAGHMCAEEWSYDYETKWPGACNTGNLQSPINIMTADAVVDKKEVVIRGPLMFRGYDNVKVSAENNGHTMKWMLEPDAQSPIMFGGPLRGNYSFIQFHLHWLSEHAIDGMKYPLEIHFVHMKTGLTVDEALKRPDGLAVIAVLCKVNSGRESEVAFEQIAPSFPSLVDRHTGYANASVIDLTRLFSPEMQSFYTYQGSLTTPQCQEVVTWLVMDKPIAIADTQYKLISKVDVGGIDNYRSLQPINRVIYRSVASCASVAVPSSLGLFAGLLSLSSTLGKGFCLLVNIKRKLFGTTVKDCLD